MFENQNDTISSCEGPWTTVTVIVSCIILAMVAVLGFYSSYKYLYKMKKYKAYPLTLCYTTC